MPNLSHLKYRPDIDGLRAVAVLSVVAFHVFPTWVKGGFIGVDVFFVISGFLISTIIFDNLDKGTFNFAEFYARRVNRIFPALILILVSSYALGWLTLFEHEYKQLGKHIAAGAGFVSNFILWSEAGYFDSSAETKPLLHLWSLGIEEQFYIVWPFVLWLAWGRKFNLLALSMLIAFVSLYLNIKGIKKDSVSTFYSPQTRFWELLSGSILAWVSLYGKDIFAGLWVRINASLAELACLKYLVPDRKTLANAASFLGALLLIYGFWRISKDIGFPGKWAVIPVLGAVLIILAGPGAWINRRVLSNKILVWFGLISFPLYLWHWPLLSFARIAEGETPSRYVRIAIVIISVALAWITYRLIEIPVRSGGRSRGKSYLLSLLMMVVGVSGIFVFQQNEFKERIQGDYGHDSFFKYHEDHYLRCQNPNIYNSSSTYKKWVQCWQTMHGEPDIVLLGDSHAEHLFAGLANAFADKNIAFYIKGGRPALDDENFRTIFEELGRSKKQMHIFLANHYLPDYQNNPERLRQDFGGTMAYLTDAGHKVAIIGDILRFDGSPQDCLGQSNRPILRKMPDLEKCVIDFEQAAQQESVYEPVLKSLAAQYASPYFPLSRLICSETNCSMISNGVLYYRDSNHLNIEGSVFVGSRLGEMIQESGFLN